MRTSSESLLPVVHVVDPASNANNEQEEASSLMRISSFCSPRSHQSRRRTRDDTIMECDEQSVAVSVSILNVVPSIHRKRSRRERQHNGGINSDALNDPYATIYTDDPSLLVGLGAFEGSTVCSLSSRPSPSPSWSPVLIRILTKNWLDTACTSAVGNGNNDEVGESPNKQPTIYVPPCVAATAGLHGFAPTTLRRAYIGRLCSTTMAHASKVVVREFGAPPIDIDNREKENSTSTRSDQDESLRRYFTHEEENGMRGEAPRLMAVGCLFAVPSVREDDNAHAGRNGVRFYEVTSIQSKNEADEDDEIQREEMVAFMVSLGTKLVLHESTSTSATTPEEQVVSSLPRRLPCLSQALGFSVSVLARDNMQKKYPRGVTPYNSLHPSINDVVDSLLFPFSASPRPTDSVTLVVGNEDNRIHECIGTAADSVGMRCIHVDGLAAFDYRYKKYSRETVGDAAAGIAKTHVTGSLSDKLSGLRASIDMARQSAPCVLFISSIDRELTATNVDTETRAEEEKRFAAVVTSAVATRNVNIGDSFAQSWGRFAPPLLVVLSSSRPLSPGPLSALSVRDAIRISRPDEKYARQIWTQNCEGHHLCLPPFEAVSSQLLGRTANEIDYARKEMIHQYASIEEPSSRSSCIPESVFANLDKGQCVVSDGTDSRLASTLIPDIKWEDVGGLSHVRTEILDAVELPLRHPELFSGAGGRSGILLFGPPGTGKTLVAKAVATECGLPFLSVKGPELLGSYVGESEANVRAAFKSARDEAAATVGRERGGGAILFFDELDSLAPRRGGVGDGGGVMERVVASLLGEMDGGTDSSGDDDNCDCKVFVIGATNRPDLLDPSLLRPGRFDRLVYLGLAQSRQDRINIMVAQTRKFTFENNQDAYSVIDEVIDSIPASLSGADLSAVAKGALMRSLRRLCDEADNELKRQRQKQQSPNGPTATLTDVNTIIEEWDEDKLVPTVTAEDFIVAARDVTPSVGKKELANYEKLKDQFCG